MDPYVTMGLTVVFVLFLIYVIRKNKNKQELNLPPSLPSIPLLGSLPFLSKPNELHMFFAEMVKRYGNVFSFMAGTRYTVVLNGHETLREALVKKSQDFAGRKTMFVDKLIYNKESRGIVFLFRDGEQWKKNRLNSLTILKQFGFGQVTVMEERIQGVVREFVIHVKACNGQDLDLFHKLLACTVNTLTGIMFTDKWLGDDEVDFLMSMIQNFADNLDPVFDIYPFLAYIPPFRGRLERARPFGARFEQYLQDKIDESTKEKCDSDNFVQKFIQMVPKEEYDVKELTFILRDLIVAGTDSVATSISWATILLGNRPRILDRLQKEIDSVVPPDRLPSLYDKVNLPYLHATILEVWRYRTIVPMGVPHATTCDTSVAGYNIPAKVLVLVNLWSAHMDSAVWKDPETFRPERFLDENMNIIKEDSMLVFSLGKRACLGELLARQETFLFLAAILQQFNILPPEGQTGITEAVNVKSGLLLEPVPFTLRLISRF